MVKQPPIDYIERTQKQYEALGYPSYQWVYNDTAIALAPLKKPLSEAKLSLIASGGLYTRGQVAFHYKDDLSYREINVLGPAAGFAGDPLCLRLGASAEGSKRCVSG